MDSWEDKDFVDVIFIEFRDVGPGSDLANFGILILFDCFRLGFVLLAYFDAVILILDRFDASGGSKASQSSIFTDLR